MTPSEELVAAVWAEVLGVEELEPHDNFFALGGASLASLRLVTWLRENVGVEMQLRDLREAPTVEAFARRLDQLKAELE